MIRWWRRHRELRNRVKTAQAEVRRSRDSLERTRREVVEPARTFERRNGFAEIIRESLIDGR